MSRSTSTETQCLTSVLREFLGHEQPISEESVLWNQIEWTHFEGLIRHQQMSPIFLRVCRKNSLLYRFPQDFRLGLEQQVAKQTARMLAYEQLLGQIASAFTTNKIPFFLIKGPSLSSEFYPSPELRPYSDLDIVIRKNRFDSAQSCLLELGLQPNRSQNVDLRLKYFNSVVFNKTPGLPLAVDLHWDTLTVSWTKKPFLDNDTIWSNLREISCQQSPFSVLNEHDLILFLCLHLSYHHQFGKLLSLMDLALALEKFSGSLEWEYIVKQTIEMNAKNAVYYVLKLADSLLDAPAPSTVLKRLKPKKLPSSRPPDWLVFRERSLPKLLHRPVKLILIDDWAERARAIQTFVKQWLHSSQVSPVAGRADL